MKAKKVAVGLSGGVDSSVAAALLLEQGYDVTGAYLTCWEGPGCRSEEDRQDALDVALQLGIPFEHLDFQEAYREKVYEYMIREYEAGRTPNPDVMCNREIKFGLFYEWAMGERFDYVATGHYARIGEARGPWSVVRGEENQEKNQELRTTNYELLRSVDGHKDQTYFLHQLRQEQLEHILFPIGHLTKEEVRKEAEKRGLLTARKPDSVGICFIGEQPMQDFLKQRIEPKEGLLLMNDTEVGMHDGAWFYTIGQRIGLQASSFKLRAMGFDTTKLPHFYVIGKDVEKNILYVGTEEQLYVDEVNVEELHLINSKHQILSTNSQTNSNKFSLRIRHTGELIPIKRIVEQTHSLTVKLAEPVRGVAPGQAAVIYQDNICLGGGIIY